MELDLRLESLEQLNSNVTWPKVHVSALDGNYLVFHLVGNSVVAICEIPDDVPTDFSLPTKLCPAEYSPGAQHNAAN